MRSLVIGLKILVILTLLGGRLIAQTVDVWAEDSHCAVDELGFVRVLCSTNIPLAGLRVPMKLESNSLTIDSVVFSNLVPTNLFNCYSQLSNSNRRGFVQVLPPLSGSPPTFYAYGDEVFRIYYRIKPGTTDDAIRVDTFYNRFYDAGHWLVDEIEASDGLGNRLLPDFQAGTIWIDRATEVEAEETVIPNEYTLEQNFPNPFNPSTTIVFSIPRNEHVSIEIFDILGRTVETLIEANIEAGRHELSWSAKEAPTGLYFYKLSYSGGSILRKMAIIK